MDETLRTGIRAIGKVPFSEYACSHEAAADGTVQARWADDALSDYGEYDEFMAEMSEYQARVLFSARDEVRDFRILRLVPDLDEEGNIVLGDEMLTPDSSRFWPAEGYEPGHSQPSFDKQFARDWLTSHPGNDWTLPEEIVQKTIDKYLQSYKMLTGKEL